MGLGLLSTLTFDLPGLFDRDVDVANEAAESEVDDAEEYDDGGQDVNVDVLDRQCLDREAGD